MGTEIDLGYDLGSQERKEFRVVPQGVYLVQVEDCYIAPTRDGSSKKLMLKFRIVNDEQHGAQNGVLLEDFISMQATAGWRMAQFLDAVYGRQVEGTKVVLEDLLGKTIVLKIMIEKTTNNNDRNRVSRFDAMTKWQAQAQAQPAQPNGNATPQQKPVESGEQVSM